MAKVTINKKHFLEAITKAKFYMGKEESRYYLIGQFFELNDELIITATDGVKLFNTKITTPFFDGEENNGILPAHGVELFINAIKKAEKDTDVINLSFDGEEFELDCFNSKIKIQAINATYPDYKRILPKIIDESKTVGMDAQQFAAAAAVIKKKQGMKWTFNKENEAVVVQPLISENNPNTNFNDRIILMPISVSI